MDKKDIIIILLSIVLVGSLAFITIDKYTASQQVLQEQAYIIGLNDGTNRTIIDIMQKASTCQPVTLVMGTNKMEIIATGCLKQSGK